MVEKLLPCPFCGGKAVYRSGGDYYSPHGWNAGCEEGHSGSPDMPTKAKAREWWNRRATLAPHTSALAERDARIAELEAALDALSKEADRAYCQSLDQFSKPECLGWEAKVRTGVFGKPEFKAHKKANELMGKHHGMAIAVRRMRAALAKEKAEHNRQ